MSIASAEGSIQSPQEFGLAVNNDFAPTIYQGWHDYHDALTKTITPLDAEQLALRASPNLRSTGELAAHIVAGRARWFTLLFGEGGDAFMNFCRWDHAEAQSWSAEELAQGLEATWTGMQGAITRWTPQDWEQTWPGEGENRPKLITRAWVIWHLIEHDIHHGGQIATTLGAHGVPTLVL